jgi:transcriptional regulator GlxA family with amidase domain
MELLTGTELSVKQIAFRVGFRHAANFSTAFRQRFGLSPAELRKK